MIGTLRKDEDGWSVIYFVTAEDYDTVAKVEMKLCEEDHKYAKDNLRVAFESSKVNGKFVATLVKKDTNQRVINEHLKEIIL